jgi:hypothetical protein
MFKQVTQQRDIAQDRDFGIRLRFVGFHQTANDDGLTIGSDGDGIGSADVDNRGG